MFFSHACGIDVAGFVDGQGRDFFFRRAVEHEAFSAGRDAIDQAAAVGTGDQIALAWAMGTYRFDRYKRDRGAPPPTLVASDGVDMARVRAMAAACALAREMIDTPRSVILDVVVDQTENCFPMIPSGAAHNEMLLGPKDEAEKPVSEEGMVLV